MSVDFSVAEEVVYKRVDLTLDAGNAYADGDLLADVQTLEGVVEAGGHCRLWSLVAMDFDDQAQPFDIYFAESPGSQGTENSPYEPRDPLTSRILGRVQILSDDWVDLTNNQIAFKEPKDPGMGMILSPASGTSLYVFVVSRGTGTYTANGIKLKLGFLRSK